MLEKIKENPIVFVGVPLVAVMLLVFLYISFRPGEGGRDRMLVYWFDPASQEWVAAPADAPPGSDWHQVQMFVCAAQPTQKFPGVLKRDVEGGVEVSRVDLIQWIPETSPAAEAVFAVPSERCADQGGAREWYALDDEAL